MCPTSASPASRSARARPPPVSSSAPTGRRTGRGTRGPIGRKTRVSRGCMAGLQMARNLEPSIKTVPNTARRADARDATLLSCSAHVRGMFVGLMLCSDDVSAGFSARRKLGASPRRDRIRDGTYPRLASTRSACRTDVRELRATREPQDRIRIRAWIGSGSWRKSIPESGAKLTLLTESPGRDVLAVAIRCVRCCRSGNHSRTKQCLDAPPAQPLYGAEAFTNTGE